MVAKRLQLILKWGGILLILGYLISIISQIIFEILLGAQALEFPGSYIGPGVGIVLTLPIVYIVSNKAAIEFLQMSSQNRKKYSGVAVSVSVAGLAAIGAGILNYIIFGQFNISFGLLPILLSLIAGRKAEAKLGIK